MAHSFLAPRLSRGRSGSYGLVGLTFAAKDRLTSAGTGTGRGWHRRTGFDMAGSLGAPCFTRLCDRYVDRVTADGSRNTYFTRFRNRAYRHHTGYRVQAESRRGTFGTIML